MTDGTGAKPRRGRRLLTWVLAILVLVGGSGLAGYFYLHRNLNPGCQAPPTTSVCTRIFFVGNSYTAVNDLPTVFANLAWSGGHRVETGVEAPNGWTFIDHKLSADLDAKLSSTKWDLVVLQEQSQISSVEWLRQSDMYPAAHDLVAKIRAAGAQPLFFLTWAHRDGWPVNGLPDYSSMQSSIDAGYLFIARQEHSAVAPVGYAWMEVVKQSSDSGLWQDDGNHPSTKGTYLAACVFYASIFHESPAGLQYHAFLPDSDASQAQEAAASTVLGDPSKWAA
ncbi:MAG TPA: DUF4886 domain-containing protein [Chloroflexota bacterium]|nr:DUF4886 domain-containing protein [Chloroflexota bacterium]